MKLIDVYKNLILFSYKKKIKKKYETLPVY